MAKNRYYSIAGYAFGSNSELLRYNATTKNWEGSPALDYMDGYLESIGGPVEDSATNRLAYWNNNPHAGFGHDEFESELNALMEGYANSCEDYDDVRLVTREEWEAAKLKKLGA